MIRTTIALLISVAASLPAANAAGSDSFRAHDIENAANGRTYRLLIASPEDPPPQSGYPTLYVLDGNHTAPIALQWLRDRVLDDRVLLVGIGYPDTAGFNVRRRYQDMTPSATPDHPGSGDLESFLGMVEQQVRSFVRNNYAVDEQRQALFGHSLGGLAVLGQIVRDPSAYSDYFVASPSLWWDRGRFRRRLSVFVEDEGCLGVRGRRVIVTAGRHEQPQAAGVRQRLGAARRDKLERRAMVDNARWAAATLSGCPGWNVSSRILPGMNHGQSIAGGLAHALDRWLASGNR